LHGAESSSSTIRATGRINGNDISAPDRTEYNRSDELCVPERSNNYDG